MDTFVSDEEAAEFREYMAAPEARAAYLQFKASVAEDGTARRYEHVLRAVASRPWLVHEPMLAVIVDVLTFRAFGGRLTAEEIDGRIGAARREKVVTTTEPKGVARIPISGVIVPKAGGFDDISGGTSAEAIGRSLRSAANASEVTSIVLDIDSPGGAADGIPELAALVAQVNQVKPVTAVANTEALSAAYWLASQAGRIVASPSARVGSIGVITRHEDISVKDEKAGVKTTLVSAGKFKAEGSPWEPLTDEARAHLQSLVDGFYSMFVTAVSQGRGVSAEAVQGGFGQGRVVMAKDALEMGMIDGIGTIDDVIAEELAGDRPAARRLAAVPDAAARHQAQGDLEDGAEGPPGSHAGASPEEGEALKAQIAAKVAEGAVVNINIEGETDPDLVAEAIRERLGSGEPKMTSQMAEIERLEKVLHEEPPALDALDPRIVAAVDNSAWDGNKAMGQCSTAAEFRSICAGEHTEGNPDERQHWALPHHYLGKGPNADGVRNALSRLPQTENLKNREAAQKHLDTHMASISPRGDARADGLDEDPEVVALREELAVLSLPE